MRWERRRRASRWGGGRAAAPLPQPRAVNESVMGGGEHRSYGRGGAGGTVGAGAVTRRRGESGLSFAGVWVDITIALR